MGRRSPARHGMWWSRVTVISCEGAGICGCGASRHAELRRFIEAARSAGRCPAGGGWMDIVAELRGFEIYHEPDGWPGVRMRQISALCDETDRLRDMLRPEWNEEGEAMTLASAAEDADEWLALIERLHNDAIFYRFFGDKRSIDGRRHDFDKIIIVRYFKRIIKGFIGNGFKYFPFRTCRPDDQAFTICLKD